MFQFRWIKSFLKLFSKRQIDHFKIIKVFNFIYENPSER